MKRIIAISLLLLFVLQFSVKTMIVSAFLVYQNEIEKTLCENKNRPELRCKGKCFLKKQLKKQEQHERDMASLLKTIEILPTVISANNCFNFIKHETEQPFPCYYLINPYTCNLPSVFHPPSLG